MFHKMSVLFLIIFFSILTVYCFINEHFWVSGVFAILTTGAFSEFIETPLISIKIGNRKDD